MDLGPIEERANEFATWVGKFDSTQRIPAAFASAADVPALLAEVERLRAEAWDEGAKAAWEASGEGWNGEYPTGAKHDVRNPYREGSAS